MFGIDFSFDPSQSRFHQSLFPLSIPNRLQRDASWIGGPLGGRCPGGCMELAVVLLGAWLPLPSLIVNPPPGQIQEPAFERTCLVILESRHALKNRNHGFLDDILGLDLRKPRLNRGIEDEPPVRLE